MRWGCSFCNKFVAKSEKQRMKHAPFCKEPKEKPRKPKKRYIN